MLTILKGLPLSYFKDLQDDKELVFKSFDQLKNSLIILNDVLKNFSVDKRRMLHLAESGFITATDLADYVFCPASFSLKQSFDIPKTFEMEVGEELHEKRQLDEFLSNLLNKRKRDNFRSSLLKQIEEGVDINKQWSWLSSSTDTIGQWKIKDALMGFLVD